jgi:hypothetical protein
VLHRTGTGSAAVRASVGRRQPALRWRRAARPAGSAEQANRDQGRVGHVDWTLRAVQELKVRGDHPLIPVEHRGRFGAS